MQKAIRALKKVLAEYLPFGGCTSTPRILELEDVNRVLIHEVVNLRSQLAGARVTFPTSG